jgi:hypothetical protein
VEPETIFYIALAAWWLLSQLASAAKKSKARRPPPAPKTTTRAEPHHVPPPGLPAEASEPIPLAQEMAKNLDRLEREIEASLPELDEKVRLQIEFLMGQAFRGEAARLRDALAAEDPLPAIDDAHAFLSFFQRASRTAREITSLRRRPETVRVRLVADRLVDEIDASFRGFAEAQRLPIEIAPPVALVLDPTPDDDLRTSPFASSLLFVSSSVTVDALHWSLVPHEFARYLTEAVPTLYEEIYEKLDLGVAEESIGSDPAALPRVLFASWITRLLGDFTGALLFGPSYLAALMDLYEQPEAPSRVTTIYLNRDNTVHAEAPAHSRVHLTAKWLTAMGYTTEAKTCVSRWDERHGNPQSFAFQGSVGSVPTAPFFHVALALVEELYRLELDALSFKRLADVPGLSDWQAHESDASDAKASLLSGQTAAGSARALVAGAIAASLESPNSAVQIRAALYDSVKEAKEPRVPAVSKAVLQQRAPAAPFMTARGPSAIEVAEALILAEVLLEPRGRSRI